LKTQNVIVTIILAMVVILGIVAVCCASPWLICDPQTGVTSYQLTGWTPTTVTAQTDGSLRMDVASAVVGTTTLTIRACSVPWGCSTPVTYPLVRPAVLNAPSSIVLVP
jgi:uncharacterized membrane protein